MTRIRRLTAAFVAVWGCFVSGCCVMGGPDEHEGRFCAAPVEGGHYCVSTSDGPDEAWENAKAAGNEPIQMWAEWPDNLELRELVANPNLLQVWLDDARTALDYVRITQGNAESYRASLDGKQQDLFIQASVVQSEIMREKSIDPKEVLEQALAEKAATEIDPLKTEVAIDKQTMGEIQTLVEQSRVDGAPLAAQYAALVDDFVEYRATEAQEMELYTRWSHEASGSEIDQLDDVENAIVEVAHDASAKPNELLMAGMQLSAEILQFERNSRDALAPHADFMMAHGPSMPDLSSGALRSIHAMLGYTQQRVSRSDATAKSLLLGVNMRRQALHVLANTPAPLRTTMANGLLAKASTSFETSAQVRVEALASTSMSTTLGLPYLAQRYDEFAAVLQMAPLCNAATSSWRESGCITLRPQFKDATKYLKVTLPAEISQGLTVMQNQGLDPVLVDTVQDKLKAGDIKGAALAHDALLHSTEGT